MASSPCSSVDSSWLLNYPIGGTHQYSVLDLELHPSMAGEHMGNDLVRSQPKAMSPLYQPLQVSVNRDSGKFTYLHEAEMSFATPSDSPNPRQIHDDVRPFV